MDRTLETLLVEDSLIDEKIITKMLSSSKDPIVNVSVCQTLQTAFLYLSEHPIDLVFLDLSLPDSYGIDTYINLKHHFPDIPVIILTGMENENASIKAIQHGAQDYLIKKEITSSLLVRSMRYAIERFRLMQEMKRLSLKDDLTGLLNRRGFQILGDQLIKTAQRTRKQLFVAFSDLDGLKAINDEYGHDDGDRALVLMGQVLRKVLRDSDLVARWGGDEFVAMGLFEDTDTPLGLSERIRQSFDALNATLDLPFRLDFSTGFAVSQADQFVDLEKMIEVADSRMYVEKQSKRKQR
ncbi:MAG: GGDEF domain-containing response regulator [Thermotogaceae bacterium]|nr:GGDEF domain-containing response regulator [Thermotogaceae bacterium]